MAVKSISFDDENLNWAEAQAKKARRPFSNWINWLIFKEREEENKKNSE
jgi:hypothetical protein